MRIAGRGDKALAQASRHGIQGPPEGLEDDASEVYIICNIKKFVPLQRDIFLNQIIR